MSKRQVPFVLIWALTPEGTKCPDDRLSEHEKDRYNHPLCCVGARQHSMKHYAVRCHFLAHKGEKLCGHHGGRKKKQAQLRQTTQRRWDERRGRREHRVWHEQGMRLALEFQQRCIDRLYERALESSL